MTRIGGSGLTRGFDKQEQVMLHAIGRREGLLTRQLRKGGAHVRVVPKPGTGRYLDLAAHYLRVLVRKAEEVGPTATLIPPDSIGRLATSVQPSIEENIIPTETVSAWREPRPSYRRGRPSSVPPGPLVLVGPRSARRNPC